MSGKHLQVDGDGCLLATVSAQQERPKLPCDVTRVMEHTSNVTIGFPQLIWMLTARVIRSTASVDLVHTSAPTTSDTVLALKAIFQLASLYTLSDVGAQQLSGL